MPPCAARAGAVDEVVHARRLADCARRRSGAGSERSRDPGRRAGCGGGVSRSCFAAQLVDVLCADHHLAAVDARGAARDSGRSCSCRSRSRRRCRAPGPGTDSKLTSSSAIRRWRGAPRTTWVRLRRTREALDAGARPRASGASTTGALTGRTRTNGQAEPWSGARPVEHHRDLPAHSGRTCGAALLERAARRQVAEIGRAGPRSCRVVTGAASVRTRARRRARPSV